VYGHLNSESIYAPQNIYIILNVVTQTNVITRQVRPTYITRQ